MAFRWRTRFGRKERRKGQNLLAMTPRLHEAVRLEAAEAPDTLTLVVPRTGWLERLSVRYLNQPAAIRVALDPLGSFVLARCDGRHTVADIAAALRERFGDDAEPLVPRLAKFLEIVEANGWLTWDAPQAKSR
ncbi:PqqD family protein [Calditerricola satsumensis]|uniref:Pyrroloquinoline quinone biosynthesis peptide chaperone PqqD n=1 Tax=Calditerricola satsumensis TaxID=373054 RepID=A0A8J3FEM3_9BACI|nr:PqqD family protein [Calditerricola satsumensis]GGK01061.1 hypothetical protein GCM10007043_13910 [Calditerricola satsumensis]